MVHVRCVNSVCSVSVDGGKIICSSGVLKYFPISGHFYILTVNSNYYLQLWCKINVFFKNADRLFIVAAELNEVIGFEPDIFLEGAKTSVSIGCASSKGADMIGGEGGEDEHGPFWLVNAVSAHDAPLKWSVKG